MSEQDMQAPVADGPVDVDPPAEPVADAAKQPDRKTIADQREELKQSLQLHGTPEKVTRLSKKVLIGLSLGGIAFLLGILFWGLSGRDEAPPKELYDTRHTKRPDSLNGLPADYAGVPKIGVPLPGDLGKPILANVANGGQALPQSIPAAYPPYAAAQPVQPDPRIAQAVQERDSARTSQIFFGGGNAGAGQAATALPTLSAMETSTPDNATAAPPSRASRQEAFVNRPTDPRIASAERLSSVAGPNVLQAGSVIAAALVTGLRSDLPGQVTAQVTQNVYDSLTGRNLLIPQGARLIGQYDSDVAFGQSRALLVWTRLILPDGRSLLLDRLPATDVQGYAGLGGKTDYHWGRVAKAALLSTILGVGAELGANSGGGSDSDIARAIRDGAQGTLNDAGQKIVSRQLDVPPTLTIKPGTPVRVLVTRDLVLESAGGAR